MADDAGLLVTVAVEVGLIVVGVDMLVGFTSGIAGALHTSISLSGFER